MNWAALIVLAVAGIGFVAYRYQGYFIYAPNFPENSRSQVDEPSVYGMDFEEVYIPTVDGEKLHAYLMIQKPISPKTVVMFGPNAGNIGHTLPLAQCFYDKMGYNVVTVSYRGYGKSTGHPSEVGLKRDADAILSYLAGHSALKNTALVLYGRSLGGAVVIYAASTDLGKQILSGIMVENTFVSISRLVPSVMPVAVPFTFLLTERWESINTIKDISITLPVLFLAGGRDELIPPSHFRFLFDTCPSKEKFMRVYDKGTHGDTVMQPGYWQDTQNFLLTYIKPKGI